MVRASIPKTTTTTTATPKATAAAPTPVAAPAVTAPVAAATKTAAPKKNAKAPVAVVEVTAAVVDAAVPTNDVVQETTSIEQKIAEFSAKLQQLSSIFSSLKGDFKTLEKGIGRELKVAQKAAAKKSKRAGNRQPSGFVKPTRISDELANFLGKGVGTEMARTAVSKEINEYIVANGLQNKDNGRFITPDAKLTALLKIQKGDTLSYFNLQTYMKHHFIKADATATA
jgi:chromatin remodeling complex protein RSC6